MYWMVNMAHATPVILDQPRTFGGLRVERRDAVLEWTEPEPGSEDTPVFSHSVNLRVRWKGASIELSLLSTVGAGPVYGWMGDHRITVMSVNDAGVPTIEVHVAGSPGGEVRRQTVKTAESFDLGEARSVRLIPEGVGHTAHFRSRAGNVQHTFQFKSAPPAWNFQDLFVGVAPVGDGLVEYLVQTREMTRVPETAPR